MTKQILSKKQLSLIVSILILFGAATGFFSLSNKEIAQVIETAQESTIEISQSPVPESVDEEFYTVTQVVDGDTLKVKRGAEPTITIRLIGIDTPETVDPRKPVQCFGKEASEKTKELLLKKRVTLESDESQGNFDKYQRALRYVYLEDDTFFNKWMVEEGYAHEYTYDNNPYTYQKEFRESQKMAQEQGRGLWGESTCKGNTSQ